MAEDFGLCTYVRHHKQGLADTALKTANSGHVTRQLVDLAQD